MRIAVKRIYDAPAATDGLRVLVDRLWPRGISKQDAKLDAWLREIAPSPELRKWFRHDPRKWPEFQARYKAELNANADAAGRLKELIGNGPVTLLYAARDTEHNSALLLRKWLKGSNRCLISPRRRLKAK